jgi:hypothetical protein
MSNRLLTVALLASSPLWTSCALVLDLDAEGDDGGQGGEGGQRLVGSTAPSPSTGAAPTNGPGAGGNTGNTTGTNAAGTGGASPCEGHAVFSGQQYLSMPDGDALDLEDEFVILARVASNPSADGTAGDGTILSRLSHSEEKGFSLVLVEPSDGGAVFPELRLYVAGEICVCTSSAPLMPGAWATIVAGFASGSGHDAEVWIDGSIACTADCGDSKLATFSSPVVIGAAMDRASGFLNGALSELTVRSWSGGGAVTPGCSGSGSTYLSLSFESALGQSFIADCPDVGLTLGGDSGPGVDDPQVVTCP